jgi:hypothetical protein
MLNSTLVDTFLALFSHCVQPDITVQATFGVPLHEQLRPRLTNCATEEKRMLHDCLLQITLSETPDTRSLTHHPHHPLNTREIMYALQLDEQPDPVAHCIWSTNLPKKVQFFAWLLHHGRLNTRSSVYRRNIRELDESYCERCVGILEDDDHIFTQCPSAKTVWALLGTEHLSGDCRRPWILGKEQVAVHLDVILLILWHIWKARNAMIFDHQILVGREILKRITDNMAAWSCRYRKTNQL